MSYLYPHFQPDDSGPIILSMTKNNHTKEHILLVRRANEISSQFDELSVILQDPDPRCPLNPNLVHSHCHGCQTSLPNHIVSMHEYKEGMRTRIKDLSRELQEIKDQF